MKICLMSRFQSRRMHRKPGYFVDFGFDTGIAFRSIDFGHDTGFGFCFVYNLIYTGLDYSIDWGFIVTVLGFFFPWGLNFTDIDYIQSGPVWSCGRRRKTPTWTIIEFDEG